MWVGKGRTLSLLHVGTTRKTALKFSTQKNLDRFLPDDRFKGLLFATFLTIVGSLLGRVWLPSVSGPSLVTLDKVGNVHDISKRGMHPFFPTVTDLLQSSDPAAALRSVPLSKDNYICHVHELLENRLII